MGVIGKYGALLRRALGVMLEYRVSTLIWMLSASFPLVMLAVWLSLAQDGPVGSYSAGDFVAYYLLALYIREMTVVWVVWDLDNDIRHGDMSIKLLHPLNPIHDYISYNVADKILRFLLMTGLIIAVAWLVPGVRYALSPLNFVLFAAAMVLAWYLRFMMQYVVGLLAFWISQATTLADITYMLGSLFGGTVAPLDLLPGWLGAVAPYLPFRYMLSFPIEIMMGRLSGQALAAGFGIALLWVAVIQILYIVIWRRGLRQFSAFGA